MNQQLWWFVARASGLTGWVLCTLAIVWGLALSTRLLGKRPTPAWLLDLHRFLGALATIFAVVHVAALVADGYVHFGVTDVLVPLASSWKPGPVAWGIAGFYLLLAVELTSLARRRLPARLWRLVHTASLPLWAFSTAHLLTAGTDAGNAAVGVAVLLSTGAVFFVTVVRTLSPGRRRSAAGLTQRQPAPSACGSGPSGPGQRRAPSSRGICSRP